MQWFLDRINRFRCFYQTYAAILARLLIILFTLQLMQFSDVLSPQTDYIFRGRANQTLYGPRREILDLDFRSDGTWLAGASRDGKIYLWNFNHFSSLTAEERRPIILPLEEGYAENVVFTPDGKYLISSGTDREIKIWLAESLNETSPAAYEEHLDTMRSSEPFLDHISLQQHTGNIQFLVLSPTGRWMATGDQFGKVVLWDLSLLPDQAKVQESAIEITIHHNPLTDIEFSRSEHYLAISDYAGNVSLHDLTLGENEYEFLNSRYMLQEYGSMVNDLNFANLQQGDLISAEQFLFGAGPDNTIIVFSVIDKDQEPTYFPKVHEGTPQLLQVVNDTGNPEIEVGYWLVSVDNNGEAVFWDIQHIIDNGGVATEDDSYSLELMNGEPTAISANLNPALNFHDSARNIITAGSKDFSVRVINMSVEPGEWTVIQLRNSGKAINDIEIHPYNIFIASADRGKRVRIWNVSLVSNFENAVPWRTRFSFLAPILLIYLLALHSAGSYLMRMYNLERVELGLYYVLMAVFGLNFESVLQLLLSLIFPRYPRAEIFSGELFDETRHRFITRIGGPARVYVRPGNIVSFESTRMQTNVVTNTTYCLKPFERVRNIISLEEQFHEEPEIEAYTRDGIKVILRNVRFRYRIRQNQTDLILREMRERFVQQGTSPTRRQQLGEIFDKINQEYLNNSRFMNTLNLTSDQVAMLREAVNMRNLRRIFNLSRIPNQWGIVDPEALISAIQNIYWKMAVIRPTIRRITHFINIRPIDFFTAPDRLGEANQAAENGQLRDEFRQTVIEQMQRILNAIGAEITWLDVGTFEISRSEIQKTRWNLWQWRLRQNGEAMRSAGRASLEQARARGRIQGQAKIVGEIVRAMNAWEDELGGNQGLSEADRTAIVTSRLAALLNRYLDEAQSDGTFPPPWMNPTNPTNPNNRR